LALLVAGIDVQITRTTPLRLMILQLRQMRLTDASTFMIFLFLQFLFASLRPEDDACA
jgi:hypothetical protein